MEGWIELEQERYDGRKAVYDAIELALAKKGDTKLELIVDCNGNIPSVLIGDVRRIQQVIQYLLDNAFDYTKTGCVVLKFDFRKEEYGINLIIAVKDTGIGMDKESVERIYRQIGIGKSLADAQEIVDKMGGFLSVKSDPAKGSEFRFVIPQKVFDETPIAHLENKTEVNAAVYINLEQFKRPQTRDEYTENIRQIVDGLGVKCRVFRNLAELKRWLKREEYNQVFISISEYQEDMAFFDKLSMDCRLHVIVERENDSRVQNCLIEKLYKPVFILPIIESIEKSRLKNEEWQSGAHGYGGESADTRHTRYMGFAVGDLDVEKGILYCGSRENYLRTLMARRNSADGMLKELERVYEAADWTNYRIVIHAIKSSMMSIGAMRLTEMARALEFAGNAKDYDYIHEEHDRLVAEYRRVMRFLTDSPYLTQTE